MRFLRDLGASVIFFSSVLIWWQVWTFLHPREAMPTDVFFCIYLFAVYAYYLVRRYSEGFLQSLRSSAIAADPVRKDARELVAFCVLIFCLKVWGSVQPWQDMPIAVYLCILFFSFGTASLVLRK
jgi:divalent metal cation (Fe/Co/Zn/Cd) transporter